MRNITLAIFLYSIALVFAGCDEAVKSPCYIQPTAKICWPSPQKVPIVYDETGEPDQLTLEQRKKILAEARIHAPEGRGIWYIHVNRNRIYWWSRKRSWLVQVYYTPDSATSRMRKGRYVSCSDSLIALRKRAEGQPDLANAIRDKWLNTYTQVSLPNKPFGAKLDIPTKRLWPFKQPEDFTDKEIIELVDFARGVRPDVDGINRKTEKDGTVTSDSLFFDDRDSIYSIRRGKNGTVSIYSGSMQGNAGGSGALIECIKKDGEWIILKCGQWVS